ncbi:hypothetical protein [Streptomyces sp. NPDC097981]|uniref:hypothetical protein n=1 Tax=Streptomyces sp. NPDC097981 TaxID=3155428 RepID=UPI0033178EBB
MAFLIAAGAALPGPADAAALAAPSPRPTPAPTMPSPAPSRIPSPLKPIRPAVLQAAVDRTARKLLVPGAMVLLRTPQGTFRASAGTTQPGTARPPDTGDHFRGRT